MVQAGLKCPKTRLFSITWTAAGCLDFGHTVNVRKPNVRISALLEMVPISDVRLVNLTAVWFDFLTSLDRFIHKFFYI